MPTLTITKTYDTGQVLTETDLDNIKDSVETFLNVTKLDDDNLQDDGISISKLTPTARTHLVPVGTLLPYGGSSAPTGYLFPYGQEVSQSTYADLFAIYGTSFNTGGEALGNFRMPDLRGRAIFGKDNMGGSAASRLTLAGSGITGTTLGSAGGTETHTLTTAQMPSHTHDGTTGGDGAHTHTHNANAGGANGYGLAHQSNGGDVSTATGFDSTGAGTELDILNPVIALVINSASNHTHTFTSNSTGSGNAHQNTPPGIIMNIIVRT